MRMAVVDDATVGKSPHGVNVRKLCDTKNAVVNIITMKPGESLKRHITPVDVFFYVLRGRGIVEIGDEQAEVDQDTFIDSPANIPHGWRNNSNEILRFTVVKVPRQIESTRVL